jgi:hypothetical protein
MKSLTLLARRKGLAPGYRGAVSGGCLLFIIGMVALGYVGFKVGGAYWNYLEVRHKVREALNWAVAGGPKADLDIVQKVIGNSREAGTEFTADNIQIKHTTDTLTIIVSWVQDVEFPYYNLPLKFKVNLSEVKRWHRGGLILK